MLLTVFISTLFLSFGFKMLPAEKGDGPAIKVYYFHGTHRCMTCIAIEKNTRKTLETYFSKQLKDEEIQFEVINIDLEKNQKMARKYNVYGSSLIVEHKTKAGYQRENLTNFAFTNGRNEQKFIKLFKAKLDSYIN